MWPDESEVACHGGHAGVWCFRLCVLGILGLGSLFPAVPEEVGAAQQKGEETREADAGGLEQRISVNFREVDLSAVVAMFARRAGINVIAGTEVSGKVTAHLDDVELGRAMAVVLKMHGLGMVEESGVFRITSYEEALADRRTTVMIQLRRASAEEVRETLEGVLAGAWDRGLVTVSVFGTANTLIVSGPKERVRELGFMAVRLDAGDRGEETGPDVGRSGGKGAALRVDESGEGRN